MILFIAGFIVGAVVICLIACAVIWRLSGNGVILPW